jgi:uncharacterized membrane protein YedE/YeeE
MKTVLTSFFIGLLFGLGLLVSGMANPAKVLGFLDLAGRWDPSLMLVMAGAILLASLGFFLAKGRQFSLLGEAMRLPLASQIDRRLLVGSVLFGMGWGLAGICPGPAIVLLGAANVKGLVFFIAMIAGMLVFELVERRSAAAKSR